MGLEHGAWCVGCCWALMAALFALGVMSVAWMALVARADRDREAPALGGARQAERDRHPAGARRVGHRRAGLRARPRVPRRCRNGRQQRRRGPYPQPPARLQAAGQRNARREPVTGLAYRASEVAQCSRRPPRSSPAMVSRWQASLFDTRRGCGGAVPLNDWSRSASASSSTGAGSNHGAGDQGLERLPGIAARCANGCARP